MKARRIGRSIAAGILWSTRILGPAASCICAFLLVQPEAPILEALDFGGVTGTPLYLALAVAAGVSAAAWWREATGGLMAFGGGVLILAAASLEPGYGLPLATFVLALPLLAIGLARMLGALLPKVLGEEGPSPGRAVDGRKWAAAGGV